MAGGGNIRRLWAGDAALWTGADEASWLGWLGIVDEQRARYAALEAFQREIRGRGFQPCVAARHGRIEPGPEVLAETFGRAGTASPHCWCWTAPIPHQIAALRGADRSGTHAVHRRAASPAPRSSRISCRPISGSG